jgi:hypothetical protein
MTERSDGRTLSGDLLKSRLESLEVRPVFTPGWKTTALGAWLPTASEWRSGTPQIIGSNMARMVEDGEASIRFYASKTANIARQKQTEGRFTGWAWVRHFATADPLEAATVKKVVDVPIRGGRTLPVLRLMEHGNRTDEEFVMSLPDIAHYVQRDRVELVMT